MTQSERSILVRGVAACLLWCAGTLEAQVYLIAGTPAQSFGGSYTWATDLVKISPDGTVTVKKRLVTEAEGTSWIAPSSEHRTVVVLSGAETAAPTVATVLSMDSAEIVMKCVSKEPLMTSVLRRWLVESGSGILSYVQMQSSGEKLNLALRSLRLDGNPGCKWNTEDPVILRGIVSHGQSGVFHDGSYDGIDLFLRESGDLYLKVLPREVEFGASLPKRIFAQTRRTFLGLMVNNHDFAVVATSEAGNNKRYLLLRKSDSSWHELPFGKELVDDGPIIRGFGRYLAVIEKLDPGGRVAVSAGTDELSSEGTPNGHSKVFRLQLTGRIFPGVLHIYNTQTLRNHIIATGKADSEVLLIENDSLYYRAGNKLFQAQISEEGISTARLLADAPIIGDAHWAFIAK